DLVIVSTPIGALADAVDASLRAEPGALVIDAGSIKTQVVERVARSADPDDLARFLGSHPMGGTERSGPDHAAASVVDGIVWALPPTGETARATIHRVQAWIERIGARPVLLTPERHDRLVAFASHLPQVASTSLMGLAAAEEAGEPEIL